MTNQSLRMHNGQISPVSLENIGLLDRAIRAVVAVVLIGQLLLWREAPMVQSYLVLLGLYPAFTCILGWDPLYALTDMRTCGKRRYSICGSLADQVRATVQAWQRDAMAKIVSFRIAEPTASTEAANDAVHRDRAA